MSQSDFADSVSFAVSWNPAERSADKGMVGRGWPRTEPPPGVCSSFPGALAVGRPRVPSARREGVLNAPPPGAGEEDAAAVRSEPARGPRPSSRAACNMGRPGRGSHAREAESGIQAGRTAAEITAGTRRTRLSFPQGRCGQSSFNALATIFQAAFATVMVITLVKETWTAAGRSEATCRRLKPGPVWISDQS